MTIRAKLQRLRQVPALPGKHQAALLLDVDGTLLDFAPTPLAVVVPVDLPDTLRALKQQLGGALGMISGRPVRRHRAGPAIVPVRLAR